MTEAKDIDDSLDFLRYFEKYTESEDLLSVVQHKMEQNSKSLDLIRHELSEDDCKLLADLVPLAQLKVLNLRETSLTTAGLQHLCMSPHLTGLDEFIIDNNNVDDDGLFFISKVKTFSKLKKLSVASNEIGPVGLKALALSQTLTGLEQLDLSYNRVEAIGIKALAGSGLGSQLKELNLNRYRNRR